MNKIKHILYFAGKILGIIGLAFVLYKLSQEFTVDSFIEKIDAFKYSLFYLFGLNFVSLLFGIYAWHIMLLNYTKKTFPYTTSYYYFAKTEIAKYIPGNIFHFVGRQMLAGKIGITQQEMMKISVFFSFLLMIATVVSTTLLSWFAAGIPGYILILLTLLSVAAAVVTFLLYPSFSLKKKLETNTVLALSVTFQGVMLGIIVMAQIGNASSGFFFQIVSIYIVSWLIGFVTPGASGGLGVREAAFIAIAAFLNVNVSNEVIVFSVLLVRFINILTDSVAYLSTFIIGRKMKE